jgi:hypothetical protein
MQKITVRGVIYGARLANNARRQRREIGEFCALVSSLCREFEMGTTHSSARLPDGREVHFSFNEDLMGSYSVRVYPTARPPGSLEGGEHLIIEHASRSDTEAVYEVLQHVLSELAGCTPELAKRFSEYQEVSEREPRESFDE